jgi:hypothetical protein
LRLKRNEGASWENVEGLSASVLRLGLSLLNKTLKNKESILLELRLKEILRHVSGRCLYNHVHTNSIHSKMEIFNLEERMREEQKDK